MTDRAEDTEFIRKLREWKDKGCGHWRVDKLLEAVERAANNNQSRETIVE